MPMVMNGEVDEVAGFAAFSRAFTGFFEAAVFFGMEKEIMAENEEAWRTKANCSA